MKNFAIVREVLDRMMSLLALDQKHKLQLAKKDASQEIRDLLPIRNPTSFLISINFRFWIPCSSKLEESSHSDGAVIFARGF